MWKQDTCRHTCELLLKLLASSIKFALSAVPTDPMKTENQWDIKDYVITFTLTGKGSSTNPYRITKHGYLKIVFSGTNLSSENSISIIYVYIYICQKNKLTYILQAVTCVFALQLWECMWPIQNPITFRKISKAAIRSEPLQKSLSGRRLSGKKTKLSLLWAYMLRFSHIL